MATIQTNSSAPALNIMKRQQCISSDTHSRLNTVLHRHKQDVSSVDDMRNALKQASQERTSVIAAGGRHSMGGQQFCKNGILLDMRSYRKVIALDTEQGLVRVQPGIMWSELIQVLHQLQKTELDSGNPIWSIKQKPSGADNITIGASLSSNIHGRGFKYQPFVQDIEEFELLTAGGDLLTVSRNENPQLFKLAIGGYGMFGLITSVTMRLRKRAVMQRIVEATNLDNLIDKFNERIALGHEYGDFQFAIDNDSDDFLHKGILASYVPQDVQLSPESDQHRLSLGDWKELLYLAHVDKSEAYRKYETHYLRSHGQFYYSDTMQLSTYVDDYHLEIDSRTGCAKATEIISELYVPREKLVAFMGGAAQRLRKEQANVIYGTIRLIEADKETFLPWAKEDYACIIFNLHTEHNDIGIGRSARQFRGLIELAQSFGGSFYLTYHKFAEKKHMDASYPQFEKFLKLKLEHDPSELIQSQWYRHYRTMYST